jgi:prepilin-type N-terminal cleavage/methylation domain-containing protein/prepilin-type processing-associated H-X9-DG protein
MARRGFTLIELLVVIAIIVILMSILVPTLGKVRQLAQRTICAGNLRTAHIAYHCYATENAEQIPVGYCGTTKQYAYLVHGENGPRYIMFGLLYEAKVMTAPKAFYCPSEQRDLFQYNTPANSWPPTNGKVTRVGYVCRPVVSWSETAPPPKNLPRIYERRSQAILADNIARPDSVDTRHVSGVNVLYGDGSGRWVLRSALDPILSTIPVMAPYSSAYNDEMLDESTKPFKGIWATLDNP